jgi:Fe2+ or Zn2+ uptake regulation protein
MPLVFELGQIFDELKMRGRRLTKARKSLIALFIENHSPLSIPDLLLNLTKKSIIIDKSTVYREIEFLKKEKIIAEIDIGDGLKRYEINSNTHHHHIVCLSCNKVECTTLEDCMKDEEKLVEAQSRFKITEHSVHFYGFCPKCQ